MTREPTETPYEYLLRLHRTGRRATQVRDLVRASMQSPAELAGALRTALDQRQHALVNFILVLGFDHQHPALVPVLCEIVDTDDSYFGIEDAVELLGEIGDARAVPSLIRVLHSPPDWDFSHYVGEKAIKALARIGTEQARAAIRLAVTSPRPRIWETTIWPILKQGGDSLLVLARRLVSEDPEATGVEEVLRALAKMDKREAWAVIESATACEFDEVRALAEALLRERTRLEGSPQ
jgi:hypothetical protein